MIRAWQERLMATRGFSLLELLMLVYFVYECDEFLEDRAQDIRYRLYRN